MPRKQIAKFSVQHLQILDEHGNLDAKLEPKLTQDEYAGGDGDCDDYHNWFAACLRLVPKVEDVMLVSSGYKGGGHTTCCYRMDGQWYHVNYKITPIDSPSTL